MLWGRFQLTRLVFGAFSAQVGTLEKEEGLGGVLAKGRNSNFVASAHSSRRRSVCASHPFHCPFSPLPANHSLRAHCSSLFFVWLSPIAPVSLVPSPLPRFCLLSLSPPYPSPPLFPRSPRRYGVITRSRARLGRTYPSNWGSSATARMCACS